MKTRVEALTTLREAVLDSEFLSPLRARAEADGWQCVVGALVMDPLGHILAWKQASPLNCSQRAETSRAGHVEAGVRRLRIFSALRYGCSRSPVSRTNRS